MFLFCALQATAEEHVTVKAKKGDALLLLLKRYQIDDQCSIDRFTELNELGANLFLIAGKTYQLPIKIYTFNGQTIRSSIGIDDYDVAKKIEQYNDALVEAKLKSKDFRKSKELWVPHYLLNCAAADVDVATVTTNTAAGVKRGTFDIFGEAYKEVYRKDTELKGWVYYIVSGHGGPDPGAVGTYNGKSISEDEYAYDISLRLAHNLMEHDAVVYVITRDPNDGIRDDEVLPIDYDETCWKTQKIPRNQTNRLQQRAKAVNKLYETNKAKGYQQRLLMLHIDSRSVGKRVDMFFYHNPGSKAGKAFASSLRKTIKQKYDQHQSGRGYSGTVKGRGLYMLSKSKPVAAYIELGNIQNSLDQKRFTLVSNRQAIANWLTDALLQKK